MKHITVSQLNAAWAAIGEHMNITKMLENETTKLASRQLALKVTLEELDWLEGQEQGPGITQALIAARTRRDRQHNACLASGALITALKNAKTDKKAKP